MLLLCCWCCYKEFADSNQAEDKRIGWEFVQSFFSLPYPSNANCFNINNIGCRLFSFSSFPSLKAPLIIYIGWVLLSANGVPLKKSVRCLCVGCHLFHRFSLSSSSFSHVRTPQPRWAAAVVAIAAGERLRMDNPLSSSWTKEGREVWT